MIGWVALLLLVVAYVAVGFMGASSYLFYFGSDLRRGRVRRLIVSVFVFVFPIAIFNRRVNEWLDDFILT